MPKKKLPPDEARGHQYLPHEKVQKRRVDVDLSFKRALQMVDWYMDRMDNEINHSQGFTGVPSGFNVYIRDLSSAMNTLSLSHARWLKANEEMYERLSDDEKLAALQDWMVALYAKDKSRVRDWMNKLAKKLLDQSKGQEVSGPLPGLAGSPVAQIAGEPTAGEGRPSWNDIAKKVRAEFAEKKRRHLARKPVREQSREITGLEPPKLAGAKGMAADEPDPDPDN